MKRLFDFECNHCGHVFDEYVEPSEHSIPCTECGEPTTRLISVPRFAYRQMGVDPDFPTAAQKWEKMQRRKTKTDKGGLSDGAPNLKMY